ncbi:uncharacterized protein KNAG_0A02860 [Huiozyma naganishii CBS 8797]|uniref:Uncharacterized protein n=1 Tax=Huiozyma naganishii (strain ATCC MYA-139 / BCRC 22969 / CBS 8797 / KCTC 17520 / NBRC 10181 / NCYC 3082 / Yp74L-3) TaxID=1071383 RepID=J7QZR8_HUIN7|nr:hypothetical protein KNAG_0A02860 [Kazachstania naganishii CBS 8797]CCK67975.1 hypothetical protein KNAG_0A02860 [Kazachstania naganishii CBS 8797]
MSQDDTEYLQEARKLFKFTELVIQKHKKTDLLKHSQPFRRAQIENVLRTKYRGYMRQVHQVVDPSTSKADVLLYSGRKDLVPWESKAIRSIRKDISFDRKYYEMNETDCTTEDCKIALDEYCTNILSSTESLLNTLNNLTNAPKAESLQVTESEIAPANINEIEIPKGPRGTPLQRSSTDVLSKVPTSTCTQQKTNGNTAEAGTDLELLGNNGTFPNSATEEMKNMAEPRKDSKLFPTGPRKSADSSEHQPHMAANVANCPITENSDRIKDRYTAEAGNVMKTKQRSVIAPSPMQSNEINPVEVENPATESNEINPVEMKNPATESNEINPVEVKNPATESYADVKVPKAVSVANKATSPSSNNVKTTEKDNGASTNIANNPKETKKDIKFLEDGLLLCRRGTMTELLRSILSENSSKTNRKEKSSGNPTVPETHPSTDHAAIASTNTVNSQVCNGRDVQLTTNSNKKRGLSTPKEIKLTKKMKSARTQENMVESVKNSTTTLTTLLGKPDIEQDIMQVPKNIVNMSKPSFGTPPPPPPSYSNNKKLISPGRLQSLIDTKDRMMECHDLKSDLIMISNSGTYTGNTTDETKKKKETANPLSALLNSLEAETHEASNKSS